MLYLPPKKKKHLLPSGVSLKRPKAFDWQKHFSMLKDKTAAPLIKAFYEQSVIPGATPLGDVSFLALDLETTGLNPEKDCIVSLGFIPFDIRRIYCKEGENILVNPGAPLPGASVTIHGITHSQIKGRPGIEEVLPRLFKAMENKVVVAHYHPVERIFLARTAQVLFNEILEFPMVDTMAIEKQTYKKKRTQLPRHRFSKQPRISFRLNASRDRYHLPRYRPHHALTDALATAELFQAQVQAHFSSDTPIKKIWL